MPPKRIEAQPGPQYQFLSCTADIAIYGGAAGGGKSFALLLDPLRHVNNPKFIATIFRRTTTQLMQPGGLWDEANKLYIPLGSVPIQTPFLKHTFKSGMQVRLAHLEHDKNIYDWQGAQIPWAGFDELTHLSEKQFFYMLSRLRSDSGVPGRIRATTNPDADSWVAKLIAWWIDQDTGMPIPARAGKLRYFVRREDEMLWADSKEELVSKFPDAMPLSLTFIPAKLTDNQILMQRDPQYKANLMALSRVERMRLLDGNWKVRPTAGLLFQSGWFPVIEACGMGDTIRYWDRAATEKTDANDPARTAGLKLRRVGDGKFIIMDIVMGQWSPGQVETVIRNTASQDGLQCTIGIEQDPGQAGVVEAHQYTKLLAGYNVKLNPVRKDKVSRALPVSAQAEAGNLSLLRGTWNDAFLTEAVNFPDGKKKDQVDALSGAFALLLEQQEVGGLYVVY